MTIDNKGESAHSLIECKLDNDGHYGDPKLYQDHEDIRLHPSPNPKRIISPSILHWDFSPQISASFLALYILISIHFSCICDDCFHYVKCNIILLTNLQQNGVVINLVIPNCGSLSIGSIQVIVWQFLHKLDWRVMRDNRSEILSSLFAFRSN